MPWILIGVAILVFPVVLVFWLYFEGKNKKRATFVRESTIEAVVTGADPDGTGGNFCKLLKGIKQKLLPIHPRILHHLNRGGKHTGVTFG